MKKTKRILAIIGVVLLVAMYASTLVFAFIDHTKSQGFLKASIACTILVPVLLYAYTMFYKLSHKDNSEDNDSMH
ncbi:hypothetical protein NE683_12570 [Bariatricus massiliensis]|uniref:Uncharacterized protein n=1 Tax=Bariatricus massiliensis TaxID=1745713 RepID=A0ABS8DB64_9FIRM|nr:hypothetical protein [Bariatricus massiliensis]MCB7303577.1 hypothetical protein [Bariatricus massiliensis]MCB7372992.1 hypothetical protein [Bariatricus massiliensis]MCB7385662.1 hypothetical protein [Bariatricus massiliensis]MCB7409825.1 hypothetical protein [Bariatricus massiliensis]MCQ5254065.1 hypothetical protein [Bariatricus massiliensis]